MTHEIFTAGDSGLVQVQLPVHTGKSQVRAAQIVAVGVSPQAGFARLALAGAAHVDVSRTWMQKNGAVVGAYYIQNEDDTAEAISKDEFEKKFTTVEEGVPESAPEPAADETAAIAELTKERDALQARVKELEAEVAAASVPVERPVVVADDAPTAADLDAVAEEQKAATETAGVEAPPATE